MPVVNHAPGSDTVLGSTKPSCKPLLSCSLASPGVNVSKMQNSSGDDRGYLWKTFRIKGF